MTFHRLCETPMADSPVIPPGFHRQDLTILPVPFRSSDQTMYVNTKSRKLFLITSNWRRRIAESMPSLRRLLVPSALNAFCVVDVAYFTRTAPIPIKPTVPQSSCTCFCSTLVQMDDSRTRNMAPSGMTLSLGWALWEPASSSSS